MTGRRDAVVGCLLGMAIGDALGLPAEGMSRRRQRRLFPNIDRYHFLLGRGMASDDTEHACLTAQALITSAGDAERFTHDLGRRLRWWFLGLPAGIGRATARACVKLWLGVPPHRSGVFSAGNGPAMRGPILGVCYGHDPDRLRQLVRASTRMTHTDPKAEAGALTVAIAAHTAATLAPADAAATFFAAVGSHLPRDAADLLARLDRVRESVTAGQPTDEYADAVGLGRGVSGYMYHTVPAAVHAWLSHPADLRSAVLAAIRCGGDTDTVGAIVGGIAGAGVGRAGIPAEWLAGLWEWPRSVGWMERLGGRLAEVIATGEPQRALPLAIWALPPRNLLFLAVVLAHVARRLLPPC
ncbi:MAG TPA: ADP-ribosylglycohydrolase family protein [Gemmataceae bacterium]|jgi:ADP-ribosylglycohydrolase